MLRIVSCGPTQLLAFATIAVRNTDRVIRRSASAVLGVEESTGRRKVALRDEFGGERADPSLRIREAGRRELERSKTTKTILPAAIRWRPLVMEQTE